MSDRDDRPAGPNPWRRQHSRFVTTETIHAGVYVEQDAEAREPCLIDWLHDRRHIDDAAHGALTDYRFDRIEAGLWRSPPGSRYGEVTGGEQGPGLAFTRVVQANGFVRARLGYAALGVLEGVADDTATAPERGPIYWLPLLRRVAGTLAAWRRMDIDEARALRARVIGAN